MPGSYTVTILAVVPDSLLQSLDMVSPSPPDVTVTEFCFCAPPSIPGRLMNPPPILGTSVHGVRGDGLSQFEILAVTGTLILNCWPHHLGKDPACP